MDKQLDTLLDSYQVAGADDALLERIVTAATAQGETSSYWLKSAGAIAATALFGFWLGNANPAQTTQQYSTNTATSATDSIDFNAVILGPTTISEVML